MDLNRALRIKPGSRVAFVGSGGKSRAMFTLARCLPPPVILTTTTHLSVLQLANADIIYTINDEHDLTEKIDLTRNTVSLVVSQEISDDRLVGISEALYRKLSKLVEDYQGTLLVEADGSRQLPLKAPAEHEPAIPIEIDTVVVVAGVSALGQPLNQKFVHRPEIFSALSGLKLGNVIDAESLVKVLAHPLGGLKNIRENCLKMLLLNQANTQEQLGQSRRIVEKLLREYPRIVISDLKNSMTNDDVHKSREDTGDIHAAFTRCAVVILAGGASRRFGLPKQLLDWRGEPFVRSLARTALRAGFYTIVVTGFEADQVAAVVTDLPVDIKYNPEWKLGQSTSIKAGLESLPKEVGACIFIQVDMPQIGVEVIRSLYETHAESGASIIAPLVEGNRASPVLFDKETFSALAQLEGDIGGRGIFSKYKLDYLPWHDQSLLLDADTPEDFLRLQEYE